MSGGQSVYASWAEEIPHKREEDPKFYGCFQIPNKGVKYVREKQGEKNMRRVFLKKEAAQIVASQWLLKELNNEAIEPNYTKEVNARASNGKRAFSVGKLTATQKRLTDIFMKKWER